MTVKECYDSISGNYNEMLTRLGNEDRVIRFSKRFFETGDYESLEKAVMERDASNAFDYAHKIKGNSLNIGFEHFTSTVEPLVEFLRSREIDDENTLDQLFNVVKLEYLELRQVFSQI